MARGVKQTNKDGTDFTITDAVKRMKTRKDQLEEASGYSSPNETDMVNEELERGNESDYVREIFDE